MDDIAKLGELLKLPNLDEATITLINAKMREMIGETKVLSTDQREALNKQVGNILDQWVNGKEGE
ncbi:hypothetical protein [Paenibacillus sp. Marseille-Q4541]|uniref:hypothetical protein n=1 Tax=Paenibacillus sp. Marseille-Q4541 TaxID=2831522 RepID=UPI001BA5F031|nr:hypothetical protein [Paenibacillus sp. Marseille-Q4541]